MEGRRKEERKGMANKDNGKSGSIYTLERVRFPHRPAWAMRQQQRYSFLPFNSCKITRRPALRTEAQ